MSSIRGADTVVAIVSAFAVQEDDVRLLERTICVARTPCASRDGKKGGFAAARSMLTE
jgi:hypothetical protein